MGGLCSFEFVIDEHTTYYQWSDFKSPLFTIPPKAQTAAKQIGRATFLVLHAKESDKTKIRSAILDLEKQYNDCRVNWRRPPIEVRNTEKRYENYGHTYHNCTHCYGGYPVLGKLFVIPGVGVAQIVANYMGGSNYYAFA